MTFDGKPLGPWEPRVSEHYLKKESFKAAMRLWGDYCGGIISRKSLDANVDDSTYVISIICWMEKTSA